MNGQMTRLTRFSLLPLVLGVIVSLGLLVIRLFLISDKFYLFLPYNLVLALIPLGVSFFIVAYERYKSRSWLLLGLSGFVWLIFFPNAPYIITDFIHLAPRSGIPIWYDAILILSFASSGLLAGWYSLYQMQIVATKRFGTSNGWTFVMLVLLLASFGVYLGRFLRWNSWDLFLDPIGLVNDVFLRFSAPSLDSRFWVVAGFLFGFLIVSYTSLYTFLRHWLRWEKN